MAKSVVKTMYYVDVETLKNELAKKVSKHQVFTDDDLNSLIFSLKIEKNRLNDVNKTIKDKKTNVQICLLVPTKKEAFLQGKYFVKICLDSIPKKLKI